MLRKKDFGEETVCCISGRRNKVLPALGKVIIVFSLLFAGYACTQTQNTGGFNSASLTQLGDSVRYGSYNIYKIGEGVYKLNDPGDPKAILGGLIGTDIYLIRGKEKALMIDLGNNYIDGFKGDKIDPRANAKEEFLEIIDGIIGDVPLEVAVSHLHPDHCGMTGAFLGSDVPLWVGEGEDLQRLKTMYDIDPAVYQVFKQGEKSFDLGGGRIVETFLVRGHSNGETVFLLKPEMMLFTGDAISPGPRRKREIRSAEGFASFTEDINRLVGNIIDNYAPYDRYRIQVYTGHSGEMMFHATKTDVVDTMLEDAGYGEWRFVQDMANVANGIMDGSWLDETNGFHSFEVPEAGGKRQIQIVYYLGALILPVDVAYEAGGLDLPEEYK